MKPSLSLWRLILWFFELDLCIFVSFFLFSRPHCDSFRHHWLWRTIPRPFDVQIYLLKTVNGFYFYFSYYWRFATMWLRKLLMSGRPDVSRDAALEYGCVDGARVTLPWNERKPFRQIGGNKLQWKVYRRCDSGSKHFKYYKTIKYVVC